MKEDRPFTSRIVQIFLQGNLAFMFIAMSLAAGAAALYLTPREEEPQIVVPAADVFVKYPGGSAEEVEQLVSSRLEKMLYQIDGVEYVYSMSRPGMSVVTVRFYVGEDREESLIKLYNTVFSNIDQVTPGITEWVVKPIEIDDVPIVTAALYSNRYGTHELYRVAEEAMDHLQKIPDSARITIHGGERRVLHVYLDNEKLISHGLSAMEVIRSLKASNVRMESGVFEQADEVFRVESGPFLKDADDVRRLMVGEHGGRPVYMMDIADIQDGPDEINTYTRLGFGAGNNSSISHGSPSYSAVTLAVAKKPGSNAVWVARDVESYLENLRGSVIPDEVKVHVTRNHGRTANEKVNNLVTSLGLAIITVIGLLALTMSWREGVIVAIAIPVTYSLTLLFNYLMGYTINRVTLFALILTLGLLVDDPIVGVENIYRHFKMRILPGKQAILAAMDEVMPPIVLSTMAVIASFVPMFFITGMMGPYMAPMAVNVPVAVIISTIVALTITPTLCRKLLKKDNIENKEEGYDIKKSTAFRIYSKMMSPLISSRRYSTALLAVVGVLFIISAGLAATGLVPLKMLPFDNKNEFQIIIDMPERTTLERTDSVVRRVEDYLRSVPEVTDFTSTVGTASPMDFNGMVRRYYMREGPDVADIRVNLEHHTRRHMDSHAIVLRIRDDITAIADETGANIKLVETPPGPPVLSTIVAEVYGMPYHSYDDLIAAAHEVKARMHGVEGVVDIDTTVEADQRKFYFRTDREKAGLNGVSTEDIARTLRLALSGRIVGTVHVPTEQNELPIVVRWPRDMRSDPDRLLNLVVEGHDGKMPTIGELGVFEEGIWDKTIFHKNMRRVVYITAEMAGRGPAYAVLDLKKDLRERPLPAGITVNWRGEGEWKITVDVFRDLGIAFSAALLGIYVLLVFQTASYLIPIVIMLSIPLTMIGIMPGFWLLNLLFTSPSGGYEDPVFFTATAMIGMIALSGIVVRNALVLIDFIRTAEFRGSGLHDAVIESGAVRLRPILLTAGTTMLGAWPITLDPIFSGLAWSIIFGLFASTAFTLFVVPVVYTLTHRQRKQDGGD